MNLSLCISDAMPAVSKTDCTSCLLFRPPCQLLRIPRSLLSLRPPKQAMEVTVGACAGLAALYSAHCWLQHISPARRSGSKTRVCGGRLYRKAIAADLFEDGPRNQHMLGLDAAVAPLTLRALPHRIRQVSPPPDHGLVVSYQPLDAWSSDLLPVDEQAEESDLDLRLRLSDSMSRVLDSDRGCTDWDTQPRGTAQAAL